MKTLKSLYVLMGFAIAAQAGHAQEQGHLNVKTTVQKEEIVVNAQGAEQKRLVEAAKVVPGDEVIYTVTFENISDEAAENVVITNPLPEEMRYVEGSAFGPGAEILFSVDGSTFARSGELTVTENGRQRPAVADDIRHIRWVMQQDIDAGEQGLARFRARLN